MGDSEQFAMEHADQWRGCVECKESHHESAFCPVCGKCYFRAKSYNNDPEIGTFVTCQCGYKDLWD
jgi:hypothetical protein